MVFNPYEEWLHITAAGRKPNDYELLGLPVLEDDPERIREAFHRRHDLVRQYEVGPYQDHALQLLDELSEAFRRLNNRELKRAYDRQIREEVRQYAAVSPSETSCETVTRHDQPHPAADQPQASEAEPDSVDQAFGSWEAVVMPPRLPDVPVQAWLPEADDDEASQSPTGPESGPPSPADTRLRWLPPAAVVALGVLLVLVGIAFLRGISHQAGPVGAIAPSAGVAPRLSDVPADSTNGPPATGQAPAANGPPSGPAPEDASGRKNDPAPASGDGVDSAAGKPDAAVPADGVPIGKPPAQSPKISLADGTEVSWQGQLHRILVIHHPRDSAPGSRPVPILHLLVTATDPPAEPSVFEATTEDVSFNRELADYQTEFEAPGRADSVVVTGFVTSPAVPRLDARGPLLRLLRVRTEQGRQATVGSYRDASDFRINEEQMALATQLRTVGARPSFDGTVNEVNEAGNPSLRVHVDTLSRYYSLVARSEELHGLRPGDRIAVAATVTSWYARYEIQGHSHDIPLLQGTPRRLPSTQPLATPTGLAELRVVDRPVLELVGEDAAISSLAWSPHGDFLASATDRATATVWDASAKRQPFHLSGAWAYVTGLAWPDDGRIILLGTLTLVRVGSFLDERTIRVPKSRIFVARTCEALAECDVDPSYRDGILATVAGDLITVGPYPHVRPKTAHIPADGTVAAVALGPDGKRIAVVQTGPRGCTCSIQPVPRSGGTAGPAARVALSPGGPAASTVHALAWCRDGPDNTDLLLARFDRQVVCWQLEPASGRETAVTTIDLPATGSQGAPGGQQTVSWTTDGRLLAAVGGDGVYLFRMAEGRQPFAAVPGAFRAAAFIAGSEHLACLRPDGGVLVYDPTGNAGVVGSRPLRPAVSLACSGTAGRLAIGHADGTVTIWDLLAPKVERTARLLDIEAKTKELDSMGAAGDWATFQALRDMIRAENPTGRYRRMLLDVLQKYQR